MRRRRFFTSLSLALFGSRHAEADAAALEKPSGRVDATRYDEAVAMSLGKLRDRPRDGATVCRVAGHARPGDGGQGVFVWSADSELPDDDGVVVDPLGNAGRGRWIRQFSGGRSVKWYGAKGDGVADDRAAIQAAIDATARAGGGTVLLPAGVYRISSAGGTAVLPADDGTLAGAPSLPAEPRRSMRFGLAMRSRVRLVGVHRQASALAGTWDASNGPLDLDQLVLVYLSGADEIGFEDLAVTNALIGVAAFGEITVAEAQFRNVLFAGCGLPLLTDKLERCLFFKLRFSNCWAGHVNGGMWYVRYNGPAEYSWMDKNEWRHVYWGDAPYGHGTAAALGRIDAIDAFYDEHFFKSANNAKRGGRPTPNDYLSYSPYRGVVGGALTFLNRYGRDSHANSVDHVFAFGTLRWMIYVGFPVGFSATNLFAECHGLASPLAGTGVWGIDVRDRFQPGRSLSLVACYPESFGAYGMTAENVRAVNSQLQGLISGKNSLIQTRELAAPSGGHVDRPPIRSYVAGALAPTADLVPLIPAATSLGAPASPFASAHVQSLRLGPPAAVGPSRRGAAMFAATAVHGPGAPFSAVTLRSSTDFSPPFDLSSGCHLVLFSLNRGGDRVMSGARLVTVARSGYGSIVNAVTLGQDAVSPGVAWSPSLRLDGDAADAALTFAYADNFGHPQPLDVTATMIQLAGSY